MGVTSPDRKLKISEIVVGTDFKIVVFIHMNGIWTKEEDSILLDTSRSYEEIRRLLPHRSKTSIWVRANKLGCKRDKSVIAKVNSENQRKGIWTGLLQDKYFCEVVDGELLADGCIFRKQVKNRGCFDYSFIAGSVHEDYARLLHSILSDKLKSSAILSALPPRNSKKWNPRTFYSVRFHSVVFKSFYDRWYPEGSIKTKVPEDLQLTPRTCLHWYLGDGSLDSRQAASMYEICLHTENFCQYSVDRLVCLLTDDIGLKCSPKKVKRKYWAIRIHGDYARAFLEYIGPCPVNSMSYKWRDWKKEIQWREQPGILE